MWAHAPENLKSATFPQYASLANQVPSGENSKSATFPQSNVLSKQLAASHTFGQQPFNPPTANSEYYAFEDVVPNRQFNKQPNFNSMESIPNNFGPKYPQASYPANIQAPTNGHQYNNHGFPMEQRQAAEPEASNQNSGSSEYDGLMDLIEKDIQVTLEVFSCF